MVHLDITRQFERVVDAILTTVTDTDKDIAKMQTDEAMRRSIQKSSSGLVATRSISTASSNECSPCCCGLKTYDLLPSSAYPFGEAELHGRGRLSRDRIPEGKARRFAALPAIFLVTTFPPRT